MRQGRLHRLPWTLAPIRAVFLSASEEGVKGHQTAQHTQDIPGQMICRAAHRTAAAGTVAGDGPRDVGTKGGEGAQQWLSRKEPAIRAGVTTRGRPGKVMLRTKTVQGLGRRGDIRPAGDWLRGAIGWWPGPLPAPPPSRINYSQSS